MPIAKAKLRRLLFTGVLISVLTGSGVAPAIAVPSGTAPAQRFVLLEFLDPAIGQNAEFEVWWPSHLKQMLGAPGFISAEPFRLAVTQLKRPSAASLPSHLAVYFLSIDDLSTAKSRLKAESARLGPPVDPKSARIFLFLETGTWTSNNQPKGDFFRQLVFGDALPGREQEFNRWYDGTHARDLLGVPGVVGVTRFVYTDTMLGAADMPPKYLSMMDFRATSVDQFGTELDQMGARFANTDAFDVTHAWRHLYKQAGPSVTTPLHPRR